MVTLEARLDTCREDKRLLRGKLKTTGTDKHSDNGDTVTCDCRRDHQEPEQDGEGAHRPQAQSEGPQGTVRPVSDVSRGPGELQGEAYL